MIRWAAFRSALADDAEFRYAARHWTATVRLSVGGTHRAVRLREGEVVDLAPCGADGPCDVAVAGPASEWRELLRPVPRPFYQDLFFASVHHGIEITPDQRGYAAWYPALRRLTEILRNVAASPDGAGPLNPGEGSAR